MRKIDTLGILLTVLFASLSASAVEIEQILNDGKSIRCYFRSHKQPPFSAYFYTGALQSYPSFEGNSFEEALFNLVRQEYGKELVIHPRILEEIRLCSYNRGEITFRWSIDNKNKIVVTFWRRTPGASAEEKLTKTHEGYQATFHAAFEEAFKLALGDLLDPDVKFARDHCGEIETSIMDSCPSFCPDAIKIVSDYLTGY